MITKLYECRGGGIVVDEEKETQVEEQDNNKHNEQKLKPSISPNKDFYYVW